MAVQVGGAHLGLSLSAQQFNSGIDNTIRKFGQFGSVANSNLAKVAAQSKLTANTLQRLNTLNLTRATTSLASLGTSIKSLAAVSGIGFGISSIKDYADAAIRVSNSLRVAGLEGAEMTRVYDALFSSAQRYSVPLESLATLYGQIALSQKELGISTNDMLRFTDRVSLALTVAGTNAQTASGALLQLSQAMGSGVVRAQEFNSILSGVPTIAQAAAIGLKEAGGSVGRLRELVNDGKISSRAFFEAFLAGSASLETKAASATLTAAQGFIRLSNTMIDAAGKADAVFKLSQQLTGSLNSLSDAIALAAANADKAAGPYAEFAKALHGSTVEAEGLVGWLLKLGRLNIPNNVARYVAENFRSFDRTSPALPFPSHGEMDGLNPVPLANVPLPRARPQAGTSTVSLADFPASSKNTASANAEADAFDRATKAIERRTAMLQADVAAIGLSESARARLRVEAELTTAAIQKNRDEGKTNTAVTQEQAEKIKGLADAYAAAASRIEAARSPLQQWIRESQDLNSRLEEFGVGTLNNISDEFSDVITGAKSTKDAFRDMADSIIRDLTRILVRKAIGGAIGAMFGGPAGMGIGSSLGGMMGGASSSYMMGGYQVPLFAKGGVFNHGSLTAFARGGVVNTPMMFPFKNGTGLMGEAGPEAIMPLTRGSDGKLGVQALVGGGGGDVIINNYSNAQVSAQRRPNPDGGAPDLVVTIENIVAGSIGSGQGVINTALENKYGLDPTAGMV